MVSIDKIGEILPSASKTISGVTNFLSTGLGKALTIGNIFFVLLIIFICWGLYKIWRIELRNRQYLRNRRREI